MRITENQKKNIEFTIYTCTIDVLGRKKEITYNNVIWLSKNKRWIFYVNESDHFQIETIDDWIGDIPLLIDNESVLYDNPNNIPKYIRDKVKKTLIKLAKYE